MEEFRIYAGGNFIANDKPRVLENPFSHEPVARFFLAGESEYELSVKAAQECRAALAGTTSFERATALWQIADALHSRRSYHAELLAMECGKPLKYALGEVDRAVQTFRVAAEESKRWPQDSMDLDWTPAGRGKRGYVRHFPVGLVAGISPFNFPLNLAVHKIAPAIAAACPIVLKPASSTPLSTLALARIIDETALPEGAVSILPMDRQSGDRMVTDERFGLLSFTGSPEIGWMMKARAGKKRVVLELGGNAGVIVTGSADIPSTASKCVSGGFAYSGQVCIHTQRIYVHRTVFEEFASAFLEGVKKLRFGDPLDPETDISIMIDEGNARRVEEWVKQAIDLGAGLLCGGRRDGAYFEPTVLTNTSREMKVCHAEVFGPVVTLEAYDHFAEAVRLVNEGSFGLQAGVFTNSLQEMDQAWKGIEAGAVIINDVPTFRVDHMPYGGVKDSGFGREGVRYAMLDMLESRLMVQ